MKRIKPYLENKYLVSNLEKNVFLTQFKTLLKPDENGSNGHYFVSSIYFDTDNYDFYQDKLEGEFFKVKIRIRRYSLDRKKWSSAKLELKMKNGDKTSKISKMISNEEVNKLMTSSISGYEIMRKLDYDPKIPMDFLKKRIFNPITEIIYDRDAYYFSVIPDFRITFDYRISAVNLNQTDFDNRNLDVAINSNRHCEPSLDGVAIQKLEHTPSKYISEISNIFELKTYIKIPEIFLEWFKNRNISQEHVSKYSLSVEKFIM